MSSVVLVRWFGVLYCVVLVGLSVYEVSQIDDLDVARINERRGYFDGTVGKLVENKYVEGFVEGRRLFFNVK